MAKIKIDIGINDRGARGKINNLTKSTKAASKSFERLNVNIKQSSGAFGSFVGNVAAIGFTKLISATAAFGASAFKVTGEIETLRTQFEVLTGSTGAANKAMQDLQQFAATTPFQFKDIGKAQQRLLSFGFSLDEVQDRIVDIGDVSAASGADIGELSLIFGQVRAAGKLTGERLLQFQERAIPIGPALAKTLGVAESSIKDLVSNGKVDFETFERAFQSLNNEGEFAFEGMTKRSQTLEGRISTLKDNFNLLQANIGAKLAPAFKALASTVTTFIQRLQNSAAFQTFIDNIAKNIPNALNVLFGALSAIVDVVAVVRDAWRDLVLAGAAIIDSFLKIAEAEITMESAIKGFFGGDTSLYDRQLAGIQSFREGMEDVALGVVSSENEIEKSRKSMQDAILTGSSIIASAYKQEKAAAEEAAAATGEANQQRVDSEVARTEAQIAEMEKRKQAELKLIETLKQAEAELKIQREQDRLLKQENDQIFTEERLIALQEYFTAEQEARIQAGINAAASETEKQTLITKAQVEGLKNRRKINEQAAEDEKRLQEQKKNALVRGAAGIFGGLAQVAQLGGKKNFEIAKGFALAEATINGVLQVTQALKNPPGVPYTIPLGVAAGIKAAANVATIAASRPSFETGGIVPGTSFTGDNVSANVNSGEMVLTRQQQSNLFRMANGAGGSAAGQAITVHTTVELDGEAIGRSVSTQVANGLQLGEVQ